MSRWSFQKLEREFRGREFFTDASREEIYETSERLAQEIRERGIGNVIFVDASARPIATGLTAYWHKAFPADMLPSIYFINPDGFHPADPESREADDVNRMLKAILGIKFHKDLGPVDHESVARLQDVHRKLMSRKDVPTLIVDTCMHTGSTVGKIRDALEKSDFSHIEVAAVSYDEESQQKADWYLLDREATLPCYPYGPEGMVEKEDDVISRRSDNPYGQRFGRKIREEIHDIIDEYYRSPS